MDLKQVIEYIAEEDLEINLTVQVGSDADTELKEEVRELRKRIESLELDGKAIGPTPAADPGPDQGDVRESVAELRDEDDITKKDYDYNNFDSEDAEISDETEETLEEDVSEDFEEDFDENFDEPDPDEMKKRAGNEETQDDDHKEAVADQVNGGDEPDEVDEEFEEMFGEAEDEPADEDEEEPTEEERSEAGADFNELFGDV